MKKDYLKKNFLPDAYVRNTIIRIEKESKELVFILLIGFIVLLPITIDRVSLNKDESIKMSMKEISNEEEDISISNLIGYLKLFSDDDKGIITNDRCEIETKNYSEKIKQLEEVVIKDVKRLENGKYKIVTGRE